MKDACFALVAAMVAASAVEPAAASGSALAGKPPTAWVNCNASAGICFDKSLGSYMVLQQAPAKACVYGMLGAGGTAATVKISSVSADSDDSLLQEVVADVISGGHWKACLAPQKAGGDYTVTATCTGCSGTKAAASIEHVTFGDVW
eukprot:COSAG02_NODE_4308_length_5527_cov_3.908438_5_plen_147_part_00